MRYAPLVRLALLVVLAGCTGDLGVADGGDAGRARDAGARDAGRARDAGEEDAGATRDAGPPAEIVLSVDFEELEPGPYERAEVDAAWPTVRWASGLERCEIVEEDGDRFLRVHYPAGSVGPGEGGAQWWVDFDRSYGELYLAYRVRFGEGFDFVRGGKLPGLMGGTGNTGGERPSGLDGWSARMMWRTGGEAVQYVYHVNQPTIYGEDFPWDAGGTRAFDATFHTVEHHVVMNTPAIDDGSIRGYWDGALALDRGELRFRDVDTFAIDGFYFSTFFGGSDATWAATRDEHVDFDDFVVSTGPITR